MSHKLQFAARLLSFVGLMSWACVVQSNDNDLTIYTYESFTSEWGPGPKIKAAFEKTCNGCVIEFVALDSSAGILNRVQLEGDRTRADIVLGLDTNLMALAQATGLLAKSETDLANLSRPIEWESDVFVPFDFGFFAFVYDTELLANPPSSMEELINAPDELKIIIQDPRTSTPGLGLLLWMKTLYGDKAGAKWLQLQKKVLTVTKSWSEAYFSLFMNGEAPMVLSYSTSPGYHMAIEKNDRYQAAAFEEGHYLQIEVAAMLQSSTNKVLGRQFLQFILSPEFQSVIPLTNVMYPSINIGDALPIEFEKLIQPSTALLMSPETVRDQRKQWVDEWLDAVSQ